MVSSICQAADKQLLMLVEWAKRIPHFTGLPKDDQVILLKSGTLNQLRAWSTESVELSLQLSTGKTNGVLIKLSEAKWALV